MNSQLKIRMLRIISVLLIGAGIVTILPYPGSSELSILGYKSLCPFTPVSTIISLYGGVTIHRYLMRAVPK